MICIINGVFDGICWVWQGRKHRYPEKKIVAGMVLESLTCVRLGAIQKPAFLYPEPRAWIFAALQNQRCFTGSIC
jgi:hypothetical protein